VEGDAVFGLSQCISLVGNGHDFEGSAFFKP
jgi:hypothetical protein